MVASDEEWQDGRRDQIADDWGCCEGCYRLFTGEQEMLDRIDQEHVDLSESESRDDG